MSLTSRFVFSKTINKPPNSEIIFLTVRKHLTLLSRKIIYIA